MRQFKNSEGQMMIGELKATELARRFGTPLYVTDENAIWENYRRIKGAFKPYMPVRVHYACKANAALAILRVLQQEGSYIDAVSIGEVDACLRAGFPPERILYTGVNVSTRELEALVNRKVMINIERYGNTTSATIPLCLSEWWQAGKLQRGQNIIIAAFGAGYTWGSMLMKWSLANPKK